MKTIAQKMEGLWPFLNPTEYKIVIDYWATELYRSVPYPERTHTMGYVYEDGSVLTLETRHTQNQVLHDAQVGEHVPAGWIKVEDRRQR
jgi:hypothetical protein